MGNGFLFEIHRLLMIEMRIHTTVPFLIQVQRTLRLPRRPRAAAADPQAQQVQDHQHGHPHLPGRPLLLRRRPRRAHQGLLRAEGQSRRRDGRARRGKIARVFLRDARPTIRSLGKPVKGSSRKPLRDGDLQFLLTSFRLLRIPTAPATSPFRRRCGGRGRTIVPD